MAKFRFRFHPRWFMAIDNFMGDRSIHIGPFSLYWRQRDALQEGRKE